MTSANAMRLYAVPGGLGRRLLLTAGLVLAGGAVAGCGSHHAAAPASPSSPAAPARLTGARLPAVPTVDVTLGNFRIDAPATVRAGTVRIRITGVGPTMHEFNVARTDLATTQLPLAADGTVDDTATHADFTHVAEAEGIDIGQRKFLTVHLTPGRYVLYCNMDGHYLAGMAAEMTVLP